MSETKRSVLFVCLGNICRSPLAEGVFRYHAAVRGVLEQFDVDSAGTGGWHAGNRADPRMREVAGRAGVALESRARQVERDDFARFDHLICMDESNREHLLAMGAPEAKTHLLLEYDHFAEEREVPDPYHGAMDGFAHVFHLVDRACLALLDELTRA